MAATDALTPTTPVVTADQLELVKRTVAAGATDAELKLYLYDCARQGVHPLDRLLHFTKRGGKYVPITSIDLMRIRAAETGEYAGSDDAVFTGDTSPTSATVTVWRLVQGQRCPFTATARWAEYYPGDAAGTMWRKMPHTMLGKCAEALALRKGFPRQLAGLYAREELDQATERVDLHTGEVANAAPTTEARVVYEKPAKAPQNSGIGTPAPTTTHPTDPISETQGKKLWATAKQYGWSQDALQTWLTECWNYASIKAIDRAHYDSVLEGLRAGSAASA